LTENVLTAQRVVGEIVKCGITHIIWLAESETKFMYDAMMAQQDITLVPVCREGEAIAIAMGLILGGKKPVVLHQNTGFFESGDSVRGLALELNLPVLMLIGYRGWQRNTPVTDTAAIYLEPVLDAWGIKHYLVETDRDVEKISIAYNESQTTSRPVAVLIGSEYQ